MPNKLRREGAEAVGTGSWFGKDQWHAGDCMMAVLPLEVPGRAARAQKGEEQEAR